jgi:hypothetical protein
MVAIAAVLSGSMLKRRLTEPAGLFRIIGSNDIDCGRNRAPRRWVSAENFERMSMPTISPSVLPVLMLFASNVFMTFAWYGHLKFKESWLPLAIMVSWGIAFFEDWLAVPANLGQRGLFGRAAQDHAGGDHADRVRRVLRPVPEGAAGLESRTGVCADRRLRVFYFS